MRISQFTMPSPAPLQGPAKIRSPLAARLSDFSIPGRLFLLLLALYFGSNAACAGTNIWTRQSVGLGPGLIKALAINPATPTTLYAGTDSITACLAIEGSSCVSTDSGGIFKSTDGGASWAAIGPTNSGVLALAINPATPTTLYAGTRGGVSKSTDGGATWVAANTGLPVAPHVGTLAIDPATPTTLYAGTYRGGVFKSTDGGTTWVAASTGLTNTSVRALAIDPATPSTVYAAGTTDYQVGTSGGGVFKSTDGGATWIAANTGLTDTYVTSLAINPATPATLYAGTFGGGAFKTTDGGATWVAANTGLTDTYVGTLAINPATPTTLYAGTYRSVSKSTDGGATWVAVNAGLGPGTLILTLAIATATPASLYVGTLIGVFRYDEGSDPTQTISDSDRIFNYLEATYPQYLSPAKAASATTPMYVYTPPVYYYRYYSGTNAYIATSNGMVYYLGPASGNLILPLGMQADFLGAAVKSGF